MAEYVWWTLDVTRELACSWSDLPILGKGAKGKSWDPWKQLWRFYKKSEILFYFFTDQTPFSSREVINGLFKCYGLVLFQSCISLWTQVKITAWYLGIERQKVQCFSLLVYHFMALAFLVNIPFLFNDLIYFISKRFFPKTCEIGSLLWEMAKTRETHGRTLRVGRAVQFTHKQHSQVSRIERETRAYKFNLTLSRWNYYFSCIRDSLLF